MGFHASPVEGRSFVDEGDPALPPVAAALGLEFAGRKIFAFLPYELFRLLAERELLVAVGFIPRISIAKRVLVAERRMRSEVILVSAVAPRRSRFPVLTVE